ncbi:C10 family peptidase, partial [Candidatus Latescibacterota bacterium]
MKKLILLTVLSCICSYTSFAENITKQTAKNVALTKVRELTAKTRYKVSDKQDIKEFTDENGIVIAYIQDLEPKGFIITSADDEMNPIIGYSLTHDFVYDEDPDNVLFHMIRKDNKLRKELLKTKNVKNKNENRKKWKSLVENNPVTAPLLEKVWPPQDTSPTEGWVKTLWHQGFPYNARCPYDDVNDNRSVVGCVATAMAQIINFHGFPGNIGDFSDADDYTSSFYGFTFHIDNDCGTNNTLPWNELNGMLDNISFPLSNSSDAGLIDEFNYACGVAVEMSYSAEGSGAYTNDVAAALVNRFGYPTAEWMNIENANFFPTLKSNMINAQPAEMSIRNADSGHAIVVDGFDEIGEGNTDDLYHLNYGWGSQSYCYWWNLLDSSLPSGFEYITGAVVNINPGSFYVIENNGGSNLEITDISIDKTWLEVTPPESLPISIPSGENIHVEYEITDWNSVTYPEEDAVVLITSNDPDESPVSVTITAHKNPPSLPNLAVFDQAGWDDTIVVSSVGGTHTDGPDLLEGQTMYIDMSFINDSDVNITGSFQNNILIDGEVVYTSTFNGLGPNTVFDDNDIELIAPSNGTYTIAVQIDKDDVIEEVSNADNYYERDITIGPAGEGLSVTVTNIDGEAPTFFAVYVFSDTTSYFDYFDYIGGSSFLNMPEVPAGQYTVLVRSPDDHFLFVLEDVTVPGNLELSVSDLTPVDVYTKAKDGTSPISAQVNFVPFRYDSGYMGFTDASEGHDIFYVSNWHYNAVAAICFEEPYHLVELNKTITAPTNITFDPIEMPTGEVRVDLENFESIHLSHFSGYSNSCWLVAVPNGGSMMYSADVYDISPILSIDTPDGLWRYYIHKGSSYSSLNIENGGIYNLQAGGDFSVSTIPEKLQYNSGETVSITNTFSDSYENKISWVTGVLSSQNVVGSKESLSQSQLALKNPIFSVNNNYIIRQDDSFEILNQSKGEISGDLLYLSNNTGRETSSVLVSEENKSLDRSTESIYPYISVLDPNGSVIFELNMWSAMVDHSFLLPSPAVEGSYNINLSLDTGPHQGVISGTNSFFVGSHSIPVVSSITPDNGLNTEPVDITDLSGVNFQNGATVKLKMIGQSDIIGTNVNVVSSSKITSTFDLEGVAAGSWDVVVTNPDTQDSGNSGNGLFTVNDNGFSLTVTNVNGEPALYAYVEIYSDTTSYCDYEGSTDESGVLILPEIPAGQYTILVSSSRDNFLFVLEDVTVPGTYELSAADLTPVDVYTKAKDGTSPISARIQFVPFRSSFGYVASTSSEDGYGTFYVSNYDYNGVAAVCSEEPYHLVQLNKTISGPASFTFNPVEMSTGEIQVALDDFQSIWFAHWCGYSNTSWIMTVQNGDNIVYSTGTYGIFPHLLKDSPDGRWEYELSKGSLYNSYVIESGGSYNLQAGGDFSVSTVPEMSQYNSGEVVNITNTISDSYENNINWVYGVLSSQNAAISTEPSNQTRSALPNQISLLDGNYVIRRDESLDNMKQSYDAISMNPAFLSNNTGSETSSALVSEDNISLDRSMGSIYPSISVLDPNGSVISEENYWTVFTSHSFTLPSPALEGSYNINLSLDTGPHNGLLSGTNTFAVGSHSMPVVSSIAPDNGTNAGPVDITDLSGVNFQNGATVKLKMIGQSDIIGTNVNVVSSSKITCTFDLEGASIGSWDVAVINPDAQDSGNSGASLFTVLPYDPGPVEYRAVIVGVSDYPGTENDLNFCDDDAFDIYSALLSKSEWADANIQLLIDAEATIQAIQSAITTMNNNSDSNDVCLFFYSGHGTNMPDVAPFDEVDGLDEALYVYDGAIIDDDFSGWFSDLSTNSLSVIFDACYSGGQIKALPSEIKTVNKSDRISLKGDGFATDMRNVIYTKDLDDNGIGVVLAACDDNETCIESSSLQNGAWTYYLVEGMITQSTDTNTNSFISAEELYAFAAPLATEFNPEQHAQIYDGYPGELDVVSAVNLQTYTLTLAAAPEGTGTTSPSVGEHIYNEGTVVNIIALANQ